MKHYLYYTFFVLVAIGCESETTIVDPPPYMVPLNVGNMFITEKTYYAFNPDSVVLDTFAITGTEVIDGETFYLSNGGVKVVNRTSGYWVWNGPMPYLYVKYPATVGEKYSEEISVSGNDTIIAHWEVLSTAESLTVPAGTFTCHKYLRVYKNKQTGEPLTRQEMWWAPGIGLIQYESYLFNVVGQSYIIFREQLIKSIIG